MKKDYQNLDGCARQEWIDTYLSGNMTYEACQAFEVLMNTDMAFREEVELQAQLIAGIIAYNEPSEAKKAATQKLPVLKIALRVAAMLAIVFSVIALMETEVNRDEGIQYAVATEVDYKKELVTGDVGYETLSKKIVHKKIPTYPVIFSGIYPMPG